MVIHPSPRDRQDFFGMAWEDFSGDAGDVPGAAALGKRVPRLAHAESVQRPAQQMAGHLVRRKDSQRDIAIRINPASAEPVAQQVVMH